MAQRIAVAHYRISRIVAGAFATAVALYGVWYGSNLLPHDGMRGSLMLLPIPLLALTVATLCGWFAGCGESDLHRQMILVTVGIAIAAGGLSFMIGLVGPILWMPNANQGPLLGFLVTGPIGFVLGSIAGAGVAALVLPTRARNRRKTPAEQHD